MLIMPKDPNYTLFWYFLKISVEICDNLSRMYDVIDLVKKKHTSFIKLINA